MALRRCKTTSLFHAALVVTLATTISFSLSSCAPGEARAPASSEAPMSAYCPYIASPKSFNPSVSVSGSAKYEYRVNGNGVVNTTGRPIRRAEVQVTSNDGSIVQCAETDNSGNFSLTLPANSGYYTVSVTSRSSNAYNTAYILKDPTSNTFHSVSTAISTTSNTSGITLTAKATDTLEGGAFNILDQILNAQEYLRTQTANCNNPASPNYYVDCTPFTIAPMVYVYWSPGVSPGTYFGISGPISFYLTGESKLFILGGMNGNTTSADMDHFDNSVILHEYAHFLEDHYSDADSPGGSHNGNSVIDPRLAWGEGFANFFQAAVLGVGRYRDTYGVAGCSPSPCTGVYFNEPIDTSLADSEWIVHDIPATSPVGEGNFREFSIARILWNVIQTYSFSEIWTTISGPARGMKVDSDRFKSVSRFHVIQNTSSGTNKGNWTTLQSDEKHLASMKDYATPITVPGVCSPTNTMDNIRRRAGDDASFSASDQFRNNDFYVLNHGGGSLTLQLTWSGGDNADLDLYLYREGYTFGNSSRLAAKSDATTNSSTGTETISGSLAAGVYMINVKAYTGIYGENNSATYTTHYTLTLNGHAVCPNY